MLPRFYKQDIGTRKRQINTLKVFNDNVAEITEDSEYEVFFKSGENSLVLKVTLGNDFPKEKPLLVISPPISHPWVNENSVVTTAPGLLNYNPYSDLGRIVQAIISELQRNPPLITDANAIPSSIPVIDSEKRTSPNFSSKYSFSPPHQASQLVSKTSGMLQPHPNFLFSDLNQLSTEELRFLDQSEERQAEFVEQLPNVIEQNRVLDELISQIEELAEDNLNREQHLCQSREIVDAQIEEVTKLAFDNERLYSIYQNLSEKFSPRNIQEELGKAAKTADEDSEQIAESFLQGDLDVEKFVSMFIKSKSLYQLRKTKEEKLCHQLDRLEKAGF